MRTAARSLVVTLCLLSLCSLSGDSQPPPAAAQWATLTVNSLADTDDGTCDASDCTLREAIGAATHTDIIAFEPALAGGTINLNSELVITHDITIEGNGVILDGGGTTRLMSTDGFVTLFSLTFRNGASTGDGGAILFGGHLWLYGCTFSNNSSAGGGGAISGQAGAADGLYVSVGTFAENSAGNGGAIFLPEGQLSAGRSTFRDNSASGDGGAIYLENTRGSIGSSTFSGNRLTGDGSGRAVASTAFDTAFNFGANTVTGNVSGGSGAIYLAGLAGSTIEISNSTFQANGDTGLLLAATNMSEVSLKALTVDDHLQNESSSPIAASGSLFVGGECSGAINDDGNNLSFNAAGCPAPGPDPLLGPLQNNGGPTHTRLPPLDSPVVDAYEAPCSSSTDQRGVKRPTGDRCDIGATEQTRNPIRLEARAGCLGQSFTYRVANGDYPVEISFNGELQDTTTSTSSWVTGGPGPRYDLTIAEKSGDLEVIDFGDFLCVDPGVYVAPATLYLNESGPSSATYQVALGASPGSDEIVTITPVNVDGSGISISPASLTYDGINWQVPQTVTVTAIDDASAEANPHTHLIEHTVSTTGGVFDQVSSASGVSVSIADNDSPGLTIEPPLITTSETGTSAAFQVVLNSPPLDDVSLTISGLDTSEGALSQTTLDFDDTNWDIPQVVTLTGQDETTPDGDISYTLTLSASSPGDSSYEGQTGSVEVTNLDDDGGGGGLVAEPDALLVAENAFGSETFTVYLRRPPAGEVNVTFSHNAAQHAVDPAALTFTPANWAFPQPVSIYAVQDEIEEEAQHFPVVLSASGGGYAGQSTTVIVSIFDPDDLVVIPGPNYGRIKIETSQAQPVYEAPGGEVLLSPDGSEIWFPIDSDGNGADIYVVSDIRSYQDETWLALWMGADRRVWVPYDPAMMSVVQALEWSVIRPWTP
jgi:CSLREA domain-containing protein